MKKHTNIIITAVASLLIVTLAAENLLKIIRKSLMINRLRMYQKIHVKIYLTQVYLTQVYLIRV